MDNALASKGEIEQPARFSLRLFGGFELSGRPDGEKLALPGKRERVLLAYLAICPNHRLTRRKLATLLWGDATDETALDNLRTCVWSLRKALKDGDHRVIVSDGEDIALDVSGFDIDARAFRRLASQSDKVALEEAARLYRGAFLDGLAIDNEEFESWRREEAGRFKDQAVDVLNRLMAVLADAGDIEAAIDAGQRLLRLEPLHEAGVRRLMRLYAGSGKRPAAIQLYRTLADALKTDLDAQPEAETRAVYAEVTKGGAETPAPVTVDAEPLFVPARMAGQRNTPMTSSPPHPQPSQPMSATGAAQTIALHKTAHPYLRWVILGGLAATIAIVLFYQFGKPAGTTIPQPLGVEAAKTASQTTVNTVSIAVLPFDNISGDPGQDYFSEGMTEEITSALAKVPDLRIVARTSASQFKAQNRDVKTIGQELHASHFIEGSVRKAGDRVRISVQLIKTNDATHVWAENYDRAVTDIFALQEEIARTIVSSLRMPLGLKPGENLVSNRDIDPDSYAQYLRVRSLFLARGLASRQLNPKDREALLDQIVAKNPNYAPAWALLARHAAGRGAAEKSLSAAQRAISLDPNNADAISSLANMQMRKNFLAYYEGTQRALALDPGNPQTLNLFALNMAAAGYVKEALASRQKLLEAEPTFGNNFQQIAVALWLNGRTDAAIEMLKIVPEEFSVKYMDFAIFDASMGRYNDAADALEKLPADPNFPPAIVVEAVKLLRMAPAKPASPQSLPSLGNLSWVFLHVGAPERVLDDLTPLGGGINFIRQAILWHPSFAAVRKTEAFKALMRKSHYVEFWRAKGWPPQCHPTTGDDFECE